MYVFELTILFKLQWLSLYMSQQKTGLHLFLGKIFKSEYLQGILTEMPNLHLFYIWSNLTLLNPQLSL